MTKGAFIDLDWGPSNLFLRLLEDSDSYWIVCCATQMFITLQNADGYMLASVMYVIVVSANGLVYARHQARS